MKEIPSVSAVGKYVANLTRAITTKSEPTARVLAMLIPPFEVSSFTTPSGSDRLHINLMYTLWDQGGGMHPPKDDLRRELLYTPAEEATFRKQILRDARQLAMQGAPLSSAWYGMIGLQEHASAVAAAEASGAALPLRRPRDKKKKGQGEVDCVLEERKTAGRADSWVPTVVEFWDPYKKYLGTHSGSAKCSRTKIPRSEELEDG